MKNTVYFVLCLTFAGFFILPLAAKADEPLPPPTDYSIFSANGKYTASFQVKEKKTSVYRIDKSSPQPQKIKLWEMDGWFRNTFLSNDGENLIVAYDGANLLALNYAPDKVMISFYRQGDLIKRVRLNQLIENPTPAKLRKTVSHYSWVETYGLNEKQFFEVNTIERKKFLFDIKTGLPIEGKLAAPSTEPADFSSTNSADSSTTAPSIQANAVDPNQTNPKRESGACYETMLGIFVFAAFGSILSGN